MLSSQLLSISKDTEKPETKSGLKQQDIIAIIIAAVFVAIVILFLVLYTIYRCCKHQIYTKLRDYDEEDSLDNLITPLGLKNFAETCYMNALMQSLASSEVLIKELLELRRLRENNMKLNTLLDILLDINRVQLTSSNETTKKLVHLEKLILWNKTSQQDAFDLLSCLINKIQSDFEDLLHRDQKTMPTKIYIVHNFSNEEYVSRIQQHLGLSIPLPNDSESNNLEDMIAEFFEPSPIDNDKDNVTQMFFYKNLPTVLIIQLQANQWSDSIKEMKKPTYCIQYKEVLELKVKVMLDKELESTSFCCATYRLTSVIRHDGTVSFGHYVAYRYFNGRWFLVNDEFCTLQDSFQPVTPYLLFYEIVN